MMGRFFVQQSTRYEYYVIKRTFEDPVTNEMHKIPFLITIQRDIHKSEQTIMSAFELYPNVDVLDIQCSEDFVTILYVNGIVQKINSY